MMRIRAFSLVLVAAGVLTGCASSLHVNSSNPNPASKLAIASSTLGPATAGAAYSDLLAITGGTTPYAFSATGLPSGLSIDSASGTISGTPAQSAIGTASVTITVTDAGQPQQTASVTMSLVVSAATQSNGPTITNTTLPGGTIGAPYGAAILVSGGSSPFAFSASGLPAGLSINAHSGVINGTPQGPVGTAAVTATVTDFNNQTATAHLNLTVAAAQSGTLAITTTSLPDATVGASYSGTVLATGGATPYIFNATGLPSGFNINASSGVISGTATAGEVGSASITISVTDATRPTAELATADLTLTIQAAGTNSACSQMSTGNNASLNGFVPFPTTSAWNTDISQAPLDPNNATITSDAGFTGHLHHDWSSVAGGDYGIPYVVVDSSATPVVPINVVSYASESDVADAPFPITAPIEGAPADCTGGPGNYIGDQHVLVLDLNRCMLYETFNTKRCSGSWSSDSETIWDMQNYEQRPWGWTSADAAGLPIFPGLVRYDEVAAGAINHAIRFTMPHTRSDANGGYFVEPASHAAGNNSTSPNVMGMRIRLKASFNISSFSAANQVILTAMKKYGMILADNGSAFYFQGVPDTHWDDNDLVKLDAIASSNFEVVQMTPTYPGYDDASAPTGAPPIINSFNASSTSITSGTKVTLSWDVSNDSYDFIDVLGGVRGGSVSVAPTATTTYTLTSTNQYGRTTKTVTVTVH